MDKNQAKQYFNSYISFRHQAKKELEEVKKISNFQEKKQKVETSFEIHSRNFLNAKQYLDYCGGEVNLNDFWEYSGIVSELKSIKDSFGERNGENSKNDDYYKCECCKQTKSGQYWCNKMEGEGRIKPISKIKGFYSKFCSQECINLWRQKNLVGTNSSETTCFHCQTPFSNQSYVAYDERKKLTHKFCSQSCCDNFCNKYNQVVIAWNSLIMERKNLKVPNFPTWEELEVKQVSGELENYVEEVKKMISKAKENQIVEDGDEIKDETVSPINSNIEVPSYKDKVDDDTKRERERERAKSTKTVPITHNYSAVRI